MGTRADFYVGIGPSAEWLGSVAFDGYEWREDDNCPLRCACTEEEFRAAVAAILEGRDDATTPDMGWPWPWETSATTDCAYYFDGGSVGWDDRQDWPDMSERKNVTFGRRSGLLVL